MSRHDELIEHCADRFSGVVVRPRGEGDSRFAVFSRATDAVAAACAIQIALSKEQWPYRELATMGRHGRGQGGCEALVRCFAVALARRGITVNAISRGLTDDSVLNGFLNLSFCLGE
jgi:hypothetical protein